MGMAAAKGQATLRCSSYALQAAFQDSKIWFVPGKIEEIFKKHAKTRPDALTAELQELLQANREPKDSKDGWGGFMNWKVLYALYKDKDVFLHKHTIRAVYDGSLFDRIEQERKAKEESL